MCSFRTALLSSILLIIAAYFSLSIALANEVKPDLPGTPLNLLASEDYRNYKVVVMWDKPETGADFSRYKVFRSEKKAGCTGTLLAETKFTTFRDYYADKGVFYYYSARAIGESGEGTCSNFDLGYAGQPIPHKPENFRASDGESNEWTRITWEKPENVIEPRSYDIFRSVTPSGCSAQFLLISKPANKYKYAANKFAYNDPKSVADYKYYYSVQAQIGDKKGECSDIDSGFRRPAPVGNTREVDATDRNFDNMISLTWRSPSFGDPSTGYKVYRSETPQSCQGVPLVEIEREYNGFDKIIIYEDFTPIPGKTYYYSTRAVGPGGEGPCSNYDAGVRNFPRANQPLSLSASDGAFSDRIEVTWEANNLQSPETYTLYRSQNLAVCHEQIATGLTETEFIDTTIVPDTNYYYSVLATSQGGPSDCSNVDSGST